MPHRHTNTTSALAPDGFLSLGQHDFWLYPVCQSFKVLLNAKKAMQSEAVCSCHTLWLLCMCLHHLQGLLMLWLILQPHGRVKHRGMVWCSPFPKGESPPATGCHPFAWRVVAEGCEARVLTHHPGWLWHTDR